MSHTRQMVALYRRRFEHYGHGSADQAIVGLGGQVFMRANSQDAVREFRPYFDNAPVYGHGPSLEDFSRETPLTVGSPEQVIERYAAMADAVGDYQRQLFLVDHAGLPHKTVMEQVEMLGTQVVPELRKIAAARKPAHVPDAPTHASRLAAGATQARGPGGHPMSTRRVVVVQAGLGQPSSTRLLAERLATATRDALLERGDEAEVVTRRPARARPRARRRPAHRVRHRWAARRPSTRCATPTPSSP